MSDRKLITVRCWNSPACGRVYSWLAPLDSWELLIACPFCHEEALIRLAAHVRPDHVVMAGGDLPPLALEVLDLPDELPSEPRPPEEA